jgi:hypothetical protein
VQPASVAVHEGVAGALSGRTTIAPPAPSEIAKAPVAGSFLHMRRFAGSRSECAP